MLNINMETFRDFMDFVGLTEFLEQAQPPGKQKPWKARRADVLKFWQTLQPGMPLQPTPIEKGHRGTRFRRDGLRITGTAAYVNSVLSHLKDFLDYENNPRTKLDVEYRQLESKEGEYQSTPIFVCYVYVMKQQEEGPTLPATVA